MRRGIAIGIATMLCVAGAAEARGHRMGGGAHARGGGHRHAGMAEIRPIRPLGPTEFRPYSPPKPIKPFSYLEHEKRGHKDD